jgi:hypothetical protein
MIGGALIAALALAAALVALLFWQSKRASRAMDEWVSEVKQKSELTILLAASKVALADKDKALNMVTAERDRLEFTVDTVEDQRDALLQESLKHATPGSAAIAVRDALSRLRAFPPNLPEAEALPDLPSE